jgi:8-oxo-dGTP diphosphatase
VTGLVWDRDGRVLLLRHRMWPSGRQWGLPTGYARKRECFEDTVVREVKEETGLDVTVGQLVNMKSGYKLRLEMAYAAELVGGVLKLDSFEVLEARWFALDELPPGVLDAHRFMIEKNASWYTPRTDRSRGSQNDLLGPERTAQR